MTYKGRTCFYTNQELRGLKWEIQTHLFTEIQLFAHIVLNTSPWSIGRFFFIISSCRKVQPFGKFFQVDLQDIYNLLKILFSK